MRGLKPLWAIMILSFLGLVMITDFDGGIRIRDRSEAFGNHRDDNAPITYWLLPADEAREPSTGTAFAVAEGIWLTARHVVDRCDSIWAVLPGKGRADVMKVRKVVAHPKADIAMLSFTLPAPHAPVVTEAVHLSRRTDGFHFGFPGGDPGDVRSLYLGESRAALGSARAGSFPVHVWAAAEIPRGLASLGGLSGGPAVDSSGRVLGVTIAEDRRRGRVATTDPRVSADIAELAGVTQRLKSAAGSAQPVLGLDAQSYHDRGNELRARLSVVQIYCHIRIPGRKSRFDSL